MASVATIFIEYKRPDSAEWSLYSHIIPEKMHIFNRGYFQNTIKYGKENYVEIFCDHKQGIIRDFLSNNFYKRGFPKDLSVKLKIYLDNAKKDDIITHHTKSWVEFDELYKIINEERLKWEKMLNNFNHNIQLDRIESKIDNLINNPGQPFYNTESQPKYDEEYEIDCKEMLDDLNYIESYLYHIEEMVAFSSNTWREHYKYRLVFCID